MILLVFINLSKQIGHLVDIKYFENLALTMGAKTAVVFDIQDIVFDSRTILKCMYGCADWSKGLTCPSRPGSLRPWEYEKVLKNYSSGLIVHANDKKISQKVSFAIEREAFLKGYYFAFSMSDCALCAECAGHCNETCNFPDKARPSFHSVGIDVFKTVKKWNLPLKTLQNENEQQNWYSAIFIE